MMMGLATSQSKETICVVFVFLTHEEFLNVSSSPFSLLFFPWHPLQVQLESYGHHIEQELQMHQQIVSN